MWFGGVVVRPGWGSLQGLAWLARVGPAPVGAWRCAMGWAQPTAYCHAQRLVAAGWAARCPTAQGTGSLLYATATGVKVVAEDVSSLARPPAPTSWAHCHAVAWTAAWLSARGRELLGSRQLLVNDFWRAELAWQDRSGSHRRTHRPDLAGGRDAASLLPIEVELTNKSKARLRSVLALHAAWIAAGKTGAVIYVCGRRSLAERVRAQGADVGLNPDGGQRRKTLRVELLEDICVEAIAARAEDADGARPR
jgi:hypothetical protein